MGTLKSRLAELNHVRLLDSVRVLLDFEGIGQIIDAMLLAQCAARLTETEFLQYFTSRLSHILTRDLLDEGLRYGLKKDLITTLQTFTPKEISQ